MQPETNTPTTPFATPAPTATPVPPLTIGKFKASMMIVSQSWEILKKDKEIMWFPVYSAVASLLALVVLGVLLFFVTLGGDMENITEIKEGAPVSMFSYLILFMYYVVMFFIANFFTAGIFIIVHGRFNGQDLSFNDGINGAIANSGKIFWWSVISATVGIVLQIISDKSKLVGKIVAALLGAAWGILTYFSLPSLVIGKTSVADSFKQSASVIRKTWGETIIINLGVGLFFGLLMFFGLALVIGVCILAPTLTVILGMILLYILFVILISIISSSLGAIFKLALFEYATTGNIPEGFSRELIQNAVRGK